MGLKPIENAACKGRREVVELLFPLTSRVEFYPEWSVNGLMLHAKSREEKVKSKSKLKEINMLAKAKGDAAFERENYFDAATWYKKAFEVDRNDAEVLSNGSLCFARMNNGTKALKYAKACIGLKSDWAMAHYRLGEAWKILENTESNWTKKFTIKSCNTGTSCSWVHDVNLFQYTRDGELLTYLTDEEGEEAQKARTRMFKANDRYCRSTVFKPSLVSLRSSLIIV